MYTIRRINSSGEVNHYMGNRFDVYRPYHEGYLKSLEQMVYEGEYPFSPPVQIIRWYDFHNNELLFLDVQVGDDVFVVNNAGKTFKRLRSHFLSDEETAKSHFDKAMEPIMPPSE